ncbi:TolC family protein [Termitidicoccus mucosus]|uniref:Transporter n=1 Tax=Termitidicoccus mucosus TaxID=1184151 RepID=A0A178IID3_9BACT|nr:hypothetical protein AW736_09215 [Opitutaceae bacterium TSB47]
MKPCVLLALVTIFAVVPAIGATPWTLASAVAEAQATSPDAAIARERVNAARAMLAQASATNWPQLSLKAGYVQTDNPMHAFGTILGQGAFNSGIDFNHPGRVDNFNATVTLGYNLYTGGRASARKEAAQNIAEAAELEQAVALEQLAAEVACAYFHIRQTREGVGALEAAVAAMEASHRLAELRFDAGQLIRSELLNLKVQLAQIRERLLEARHQAEFADRYFFFLLGGEETDSVVLDQADASATAFAAPETPSIVNRAELQGMRRRVAAAEKNLAAVRRARRPTVNAFAGYQHDQGWRRNGDGRSWVAGIQAEVSLFDGPLTPGRINQAQAEVEQARAGLRRLELSLGLELEQARLAHQLALEQLAVTASLIEQADEAARISRERFEKGVLLTAELIGVETRLTEARMRRAVALANERIAVVEFRRASGLPVIPK